MCFPAGKVHGPNGPFLKAPTEARSTLGNVLPPLENRDPGDETAEDDD